VIRFNTTRRLDGQKGCNNVMQAVLFWMVVVKLRLVSLPLLERIRGLIIVSGT